MRKGELLYIFFYYTKGSHEIFVLEKVMLLMHDKC